MVKFRKNTMVLSKSETPYLVKPLPVLFLGGLILVNFIAIFQWDPFYVGSLFSFLYIIIIPGFLMLPFLIQKKLAPMLGIAFSVALSILMLMLVGLGLNTTLPHFGMSQPLTTVPLLIAFDGLIYLLLIFNYVYKKNSPFEFHEFNARNWAIVGLSLLLPIFACLGAISLNNGGSNFFMMLALGLTVLLVPMMIIDRPKKNPSIPPITLYMMALAFLLANSMRGWFITGHDILLEYHVFTLVNNAHLWSMALYQDPYTACLSLTILPTYLQNLLHISNIYIFKFFTQFLGALPVIIIYYLAKEYVSEAIAFLASFLYISFPTFMVDMAFLNRQGIAFLFFGALIFVMLASDHFGKRMRTALLLLLGTGMVLSHYSTSYVALGLFVLAYVVNQILRLTVRTDRYRKPNLLTLPFVIGLVFVVLTWSTLITKTSTTFFSTIQQIAVNVESLNLGKFSGVAKYSLVQSQQKTPQDSFNQFVQQNIAQARNPGNESNFFPLSLAESYSTVPISEPLIPLTRLGTKLQSLLNVSLSNFFNGVKQTYARVMQVLLLIGLLGLAVGYGVKKNLLRYVQREYVALSTAGVAILVGQTILPPSAVDYGLLRLFQQNLIFLALPIMLGFLAVSTIITRNRKGQLLICSGIILFFFVILSGFLPQFTGGARPPLPLDNYGLYYDAYYTHAQEVSSFGWLVQNRDTQLPVQSDRYFSNTKILAYTGVAPLPGLLPETIEKNSYVYLNFNNVGTGDVIEYINGDIAYYAFPAAFLQDNKNLIYNNGGSEIYR
jgi:uncharacterized membrane protein